MEITRIFDILELHQKTYKKSDALASKLAGKWKTISSEEYVSLATHFSMGLLARGLKKDDKIAIISNNRPEWNIIDMGALQAGITSIPIYPTISEDDYKYILQHAEPKLVFVSDKNLAERLQPIISENNQILALYAINDLENVKNWREILELGQEKAEEYRIILEDIKQSIKPDDLATLIYTSGTTGFPKGVMLSHKNLVSNFKAAGNIHNFDHRHKTLSFLPLSHVFERMVNYHFQSKGLSIYYAENMGTIADNLREVKPHVFISVPRLLESVYDKIIGKGKELGWIKRGIFFWAVRLGMKYNYNHENGWWYHLRLRIADALIFKKWREALGGNTSLIIIGGAALQPRLSRIFGAAGINTLEGYGLTETSPVIAANNIISGKIKIGTVGCAFEQVKIKIADDGEILAQGPNIMLGYYKQPELTAEVIDKEGWFHTGDIGTMIEGKYLKITDRKKEIFKLSSGKYIAPQPIENKFKESFFIEQVMVVGENQKFASALIAPNFNYLHSWASQHHISFRDNQELVSNAQVVTQFQKEVNALNKFFGQTEQIKRFRLVCDEWTPQSGALSPTLKLKRKHLYDKYDHIIREIYSVEKNHH